MFSKGLKKVLSFLSIVVLLSGQILTPALVLAQEATPSATSEPAPSPTPEPSPEPDLSAKPQASSSAQEATDSASLTAGIASASEQPPVVLGQVYKAAEEKEVTVTFTKLPQSPGTLTIKQIKFTQEQILKSSALSDSAYEITSSMEDGTFEYTLTLPTPKTDNVEVKTSEDGQNFTTVGGVTAQEGVLTITGLNHFTIFVVAGTIEDDVAEPFNESNAQVVINEFVFDDNPEWVEIYNRTNQAIDLSGWTLEDEDITSDINLSGTIQPNGLLVFQRGLGWLDNSGDTITLKDDAGNVVDRVTYRDRDVDEDGVVIGAQDVGEMSDEQSLARSEDGLIEGENIWEVFSNTTKGYNNSGDITFLNVGNIYPFESIQQGINNVAEGGTVNVAEGEYQETLVTEQSLILRGAGIQNSIIIDNDCNGDPTLGIDADNVTVQDFTIDNDGCEGSVVRIGNGVSGVIIQGNELTQGYYGIELQSNASSIQMLNNEITDNDSSGIYSGSSAISNITISGNTIQSNGESGIYLDQVTETISVSDNTISNNSSYGIYFGTVLDATLTIGGEEEDDGNTITNNGSTGIYLSGGGASVSNSAVTISGNTISSNQGDGIYADVIVNSPFFDVLDNTIENNSGNGIYVCAEGYCSNSTLNIKQNSVSENNSNGLYLYSILSSTVRIDDNKILSNSETGIYIQYIGTPSDSSVVTLTNNTVSGNSSYGVYFGSVDEVLRVEIGSGNTISGNGGAGIYLDSQVQGVGITGNTITDNGVVSDETGIVVLSATDNEAHENIISGNGLVGVLNEDEQNNFDATENFWGDASGPFNENLNPDGSGNSVSDNVLFSPFYTDSDLTTLEVVEINADNISSFVENGIFDIPDNEEGQDLVEFLTILQQVEFEVQEGGGENDVILPAGVRIERSDDQEFEWADLSIEQVVEETLSGLATGEVVEEALQWGIPNQELEFNQAITLRIFVGTALNGQTLNIKRSTSGSAGWTAEGIVAPATCVVASGLCEFQATKASYFATTRTVTTTSSSSSSGGGQALSQAGGGGSAPTCNDQKPGSAPTLLSATTGTNNVTLGWSKAKDPVTYYLVNYSTNSGIFQFGNPNVGGPDTTSYTISGLSGGITYYFKVRAGNGCMPGDYSNELSATPGGGFIAGPAAGFQEGVLGVSEPEQGQVQGETTTSSPQPTSTTQPRAGGQSPLNVKTVVAVVIALIIGFGIFKLLVK